MAGKFPKRYVIVVLTFLSTSICYIERIGFSIGYTVAEDSIGLNQSTKGKILSTFYYGYAISQIPGGWLAQRFGGRHVLLCSFVFWSLTCALVPLDPHNVTMLVIGRFLVGVTQGFIFPSVHAVLAHWVPKNERSISVSFSTSGMYLGAALGMLVVPSLVRLNGPRSVLFVEALLGALWSVLWLTYSIDPAPLFEPSRSSEKIKPEEFSVPWRRIIGSFPIWAIVVNNFTFHYTLYVLMNWLPTYFEQALKLGLQEMGIYKMLPYLNMFFFSNIGGVLADRLIESRVLSVTKTRKFFNTAGFLVASFSLVVLPIFRTSEKAVFCASLALGFLALGRAGFAVNHMDIAPKYAGIVMGISNTAGTLAGIIGVDLTGKLLEAAKSADKEISSPESWRAVFAIPGVLCILSSIGFFMFSTGERIFD